MHSSQIIDELTAQSGVVVDSVRFEHLRETLGIGFPQPRLSWTVKTSAENWLQAAYEIEAYCADGTRCATTGRIVSAESVLVPWPFSPLTSRQKIAVRVRVWGSDGSSSPWSELAQAETGLFNPEDWTGQFIRPDWEADPSQRKPGPLLRKDLVIEKEVRQARLYSSALGVYEALLNGTTVGDHVMAPGWTSYHHRLRYQTFDVTALIQHGANVMGAMLGNGWFRGRLGFGGGRSNIYGDRIAFLAQLEVEYADGTTEVIVTDPSWKAAPGPILADDIYDGEVYDARLEQPGWSGPGFDDRSWAGVRVVERDFATLIAPAGPPVRRTAFLDPISISKSPSGRTLVDFGQNLVGWIRLSVRGPAGQKITLRHAEVLENGELSTRPLRHARATDCYTLRGSETGDPEIWEPRFTYHGFRYAEIEGWPGELQSENIQAVVCHSDMERTGWFECSDPLINQFHENVVWSMRGNFFDVPTDCPQRDERLGWTGDIQIFSPTASFLFQSAGFFTSWLADLAVEQKTLGVVPFVVPTVMPKTDPPAAAWGDAAVIIPWVVYERFGDKKILAEQFESMRAWVDLIDQTAGEDHLWDQGFQFGDWLDPAAPPENPGDARTPGFIVATAYFARSAEILGQAAQVLERKAEADRYLKLASDVRSAFNHEYVTHSGRLLSDSATAYALALQFSLLPDEAQRQHAANHLVTLARSNRFRISTGFVGTPLICDALCSQGHITTAYRLLTQKECPSWLYPVTMGATTIWERWDSMLPDGTINPGEMTSFNHYALGAVADWLHRTVAGLAPALPGYKRLEICPHPGGGLTYAAARHNTPYGPAACEWKLTSDGSITITVEVPPNTTASMYLPGSSAAPLQVGSGKHTWNYPYQTAAESRKSLTVEDRIGDFIEDPAALEVLMTVIADRGPGMVNGLLAQEDTSLRDAVGFWPWGDELLNVVSDALAKLDQENQ